LEEENQEFRSRAEYFGEVLDNSQDMILRRDYKKGALEYISPAITAILGYQPEEISSTAANELMELVHPDDRPAFVKNFDALFEIDAKTVNTTIEYRLKRKDGEYIWISEQLTVVKDAHGIPDFVVGNARDVTKRKQTEEELRKSEQKFRSVVDNIGIGIALISPKMEILSLNTQMKNWFPDINTIHKPTCYESFNDPPRKQVCSYCPTVKTLKDGHVYEAITETPAAAKIVNYRIMASPIKDEDGNVIAAIEMVEDITEKKRTEESLKKVTHELAERVKELSCLYGISSLVEKPSISTEELLQGTVELVRLSWQYPEDTCTRIILEDQIFTTNNFTETNWKQASEIIVNGKRLGNLEVYYLEEKPPSDEGPFQHEERALINAVAGRLGRILELKRAQEALQQAHDELELRVQARTAELAQANNILRKSEARVQELNKHILNMLMVGSHDLRSPLLSLSAMVKLLLRGVYGEMDESVKNTLVDLHGRVNKVLGAAEDCLGKASVVTGKVDFERKGLDLREDIIDPVLDELSGEIEKENILIDSRLGAIPGNEILINANRVWLKIVFRNLFHNAIKHAGKGGRISFGFEDNGSHYKLNVYNSGEPVPVYLRDKLFSKFFSVQEKDSHLGKGMGLGLYLVKEIIEHHGGAIWYEPKEDGSNFVFTLPYE
jgi:PAS domain S-box-containing protein